MSHRGLPGGVRWGIRELNQLLRRKECLVTVMNHKHLWPILSSRRHQHKREVFRHYPGMRGGVKIIQEAHVYFILFSFQLIPKTTGTWLVRGGGCWGVSD